MGQTGDRKKLRTEGVEYQRTAFGYLHPSFCCNPPLGSLTGAMRYASKRQVPILTLYVPITNTIARQHASAHSPSLPRGHLTPPPKGSSPPELASGARVPRDMHDAPSLLD